MFKFSYFSAITVPRRHGQHFLLSLLCVVFEHFWIPNSEMLKHTTHSRISTNLIKKCWTTLKMNIKREDVVVLYVVIIVMLLMAITSWWWCWCWLLRNFVFVCVLLSFFFLTASGRSTLIMVRFDLLVHNLNFNHIKRN